MTTGPGKTVAHASGESRFVVDCRVNPAELKPATLVGHVKTTDGPEAMMVRGGANERLKTVPRPEVPPEVAAPNSALSDENKPAAGNAPSAPLKLCRFVNPVPSVLTLNTVPSPQKPPPSAVPYNVLPETTRPAAGEE